MPTKVASVGLPLGHLSCEKGDTSVYQLQKTMPSTFGHKS